MYFFNFNIIDVDIWNKPEIQDIVNKIDEQGYIFYCRWGDAPLQTIILSLYDSNRNTKVNFKHSKNYNANPVKMMLEIFIPICQVIVNIIIVL
jgi:hypothetical protein